MTLYNAPVCVEGFPQPSHKDRKTDFSFSFLFSKSFVMAGFSSLALGALLLGVQVAHGVPSDATTKLCNEANNALPGKVLTPGLLAAEYVYESQQYWASNLRGINPACIVQPNSAQDAAIVVKLLNKYPTVRFATRSGGHDPNKDHTTIQDGVLITMTDLVGASYDAQEDVAYVRPGGEWNDVIGDLEKSGVAIAGGRLGMIIPAPWCNVS